MVDPQQEIPLFGLVTQIPSQQIKIPCSSLLLAVKVSFRRDFNSRKLQWTILYLSVFKTFFENVLFQTMKCPKSNKPSNQYLPGAPQGVTQQDCGLTLILQNRTWRPCLLLSSLYYKYGMIRCLDLHFSDRTVRLIEIFAKIPNQVV